MMTVFYPLLFGALSAFFLYTGLQVVTKKRPLLLSSRYFFGVVVLAFMPQFVNSAKMINQHGTGGISVIFLISPLMLVFLLVFLWIQMKGFIAIGIRDNTFRDALHHSLHQNNLEFEERLSLIVLTEEEAELQVAIQSWIGTGQIKLKRSKKQRLLKTIVAGIDAYYTENQVKPNYVTAVFYIIMGTLTLVFAGFLVFVLQQLNNPAG